MSKQQTIVGYKCIYILSNNLVIKQPLTGLGEYNIYREAMLLQL